MRDNFYSTFFIKIFLNRIFKMKRRSICVTPNYIEDKTLVEGTYVYLLLTCFILVDFIRT